MGRHHLTVLIQRRQIILPTGVAHDRRHGEPRRFVLGQCLGLFVLVALDGVLGIHQGLTSMALQETLKVHLSPKSRLKVVAKKKAAANETP